MKKIILLMILISFISCNNAGPKKPKNLLSKSEMTNLIYDIHIANKTTNILPLDSVKNKNYMSVVSQKHKTDSTRFKKSNEYYIYHIADYREIYDSVYQRMDKELKILERKNHLADSIKRAKKPKKPKIKKNLKHKKILKQITKPTLIPKKKK